MLPTLDIAHLRTLVAIQDSGGFGRAAAELGLGQSTVSQHVRALERRLDRQLVEKDGRRARFTAAGEQLIGDARRILAVHDEAVERFVVDHRRELVVGLTETAAEQVLPEMITTLRSAFPGRQVRFQIERSTRMIEEIERGSIDLAVILDTGEGAGALVGSLPLKWYAAPGWTPLGDAAVSLVAYTEPCGMRRRALQRLELRGSRVQLAAESGNLEGIIAAARAGLGVAVLPSAGTAPAGLVERTELPELGGIFVRVIARRGADVEVERAAVGAVEDFFVAARALQGLSA